MPGGSVPAQVVDDDEAALAGVGSMSSSKAPTPSGSTGRQRRWAHRSLAYMMIVTFRERTDDAPRRVECVTESPGTVTRRIQTGGNCVLSCSDSSCSPFPSHVNLNRAVSFSGP